MVHMATHNMGLLVALIVSLLLLAGGGRRWNVRFADAAKTTAPNSEMPKAYWEAVLPGVPLPQAISDMLAQQNVVASEDHHDVTISSNNLKFLKGLRKMGPSPEEVQSEPDHGDLKEISVSYGSQDEDGLNKPKVRKDLKGPSMPHEQLVNVEVDKTCKTNRAKLEENQKEISVSYGSNGEMGISKISPNLKKILAAYRAHKQENIMEISVSYGSKGSEDLKEISVSYGLLDSEKDLKQISVSYGVDGKDVLKEMAMSYGAEGGESVNERSMSYVAEGGEKVKEISMSYGAEGEESVKEISKSYGAEGGENVKEISMSYGAEGEESVKEISMSYGTGRNKNPMEGKMSYGTEQGNIKEISVSYGSADGKDEHNEVFKQGEEDPSKATISYESEQQDDPNKATMSYGSEQEEDPHRVTMSYGSEHEDDPNKATVSYGLEEEEDPHKVTMSYGSEEKEDPHKVTMSYGSEQKEDPHKVTMSYGSHEAHIAGDHGGHHHHVHAHSHGNKRALADVFFFHDILRPGSIITPTIPPTTSMPALLPRRVADSIPFSTRRLSDIMAMFTPASLRMAREIRWTLDTCARRQTLPGEKAGCATSLESLTELPASLLGTHNIRAFSAANLPVEVLGTRALRGRYNVTAVREVSGESSEIVTCHDLTYPYAVYYCHTANPTAAYSVTLTSVEDTTAPATLEALVVCHLDTSRWSPKNPFLELHKLKPGEVTVCHFLTKLSIIWVPGREQGHEHAAAL